MKFEMQCPGKVLFGRKISRQLPEMLPEGSVFIICGRHALPQLQAEILPRIVSGQVQLFSNFPAEAPLDITDAALDAARKIKARSIIGWGGGSCIDAAKSVAALLDSSMSASAAFHADAALNERSCFFAAVPTTAGTAAEMTPNAVLCDPVSGIKKSLRGSAMFADAALIDPELLESAGENVIYSSGFDALTQGIESTISAKADAMTMMLSVEGTSLTWEGLKLYASGCREKRVFDMLARGCMLSGAAFVRSGLGAAHGVGHPVSGRKGVPHGVCCAILLVEVLKWNLPAVRPQMEQLALRLNFGSPEEFIGEIAGLRRLCGLPENFKQWDLSQEDIAFAVQNCRSGSMKANPRPMSDAEVAALLEKLI